MVWCFNRMRVSRMADLARRVLSIQSHVVRWFTENQYFTQYQNISGDVFLWLKAFALCFGFLNVTVFLSVVMLETSRPPSLCNCLTLRQGQKLLFEGIDPILCTLLMLLTLIFHVLLFTQGGCNQLCSVFKSHWLRKRRPWPG